MPPGGMTGTMLAFDFREGGSYRMRLTYKNASIAPGKTSDDSDEAEVRIDKLVLDRRIEQSVTFDSDDPKFSGLMRIIWMFTVVEDGTLVGVRCEDVPIGITVEDHEAGLNSTLNNLAAFAEAGR
jgi:uncharacterized protein YndB with AHSA1/START domain